MDQTDFPKVFPEIIQLVTRGHSLRKIGRKFHFAVDSFYTWLLSENDAQNQYARAREWQSDTIFDEILDLRSKATPANAHAIRVQIDARRWIAAKLKPRVYGERGTEVNVDARQQIVVLTEEKTRELQERIKRLRDSET